MISMRAKSLSLLAATALVSSSCGVIDSLLDAGTKDSGSEPMNMGDAGPACGGDAGPACVVTITSGDMKYEPEVLNVVPGAVVTVKNLDTMPHSATSKTAKGTYVAGAVNGISFDTGIIQGNSQSEHDGSFTIPADAHVGTSVYYMCTVHYQGMGNEPHIVVQ